MRNILHVLFWVAFGLFTILMLFGCRRADAPATREDTSGYTSDALGEVYVETSSIRAIADPETGCQYIVLYSDGITPRMKYDEFGRLVQMGCKLPRFVNPVTGE